MQVHFTQLSRLLGGCVDLWRPVPFYLPELPWESRHRSLAEALARLSDESVAALDADSTALTGWLAERIPMLANIAGLDSVPRLACQQTDYPGGFERDIPGRKWQQVTAFTGCLPHIEGPVLEWCSGKAHLGRAICRRFGTPVTALERDPALCRQGSALSQRLGLDVQLHQCDVLSPQPIAHTRHARHAVALHACGDLHRRLIEHVTTHGTQSLHLAPCCYHLTTDTQYRPYSQAARGSGLVLSRDDCRLAVQETVTAAAATSARRNRKAAWRLGFDALQRQLRGVDQYLPVPSMPDAGFNQDFAAFCRHAARLKGLPLPRGIDWPQFQRRGWERHARVSRMELLRHAFRRPLELWLALDRALHLAECNYQVTLGTFCARRLTPRNLMIRASLR